MLKRWLNTIICIWIINSIICFHAINPFIPGAVNCNVADGECVVSNTVIDSIIQVAKDLADNNDHDHDHKIITKSRYLFSRNLISSLAVPTKSIFNFLLAPLQVSKAVKNYEFVKAFLPKYYNFLFRLSPF